MKSIPWRHWLHLAIRIGITPQDFWRLSVAEWRALLSVDDDSALTRDRLAQLMGAFPDKEENDG